MGCWNKTCGLTQLPIHDGERVVTFLLVKVESGYDSYCYNNWAWNLIPLPIYGKYNDYGWMEEDAGQENKLKLLSEFFKGDLTRRNAYREGIADGPEDLGWNASDDVSGLDEQGYIRYDALKDDPFVSFEALGESMHGSMFGRKDYGGEVCEISHMMIREDAFHTLRDGVLLGDGYYPAVELEHLRKVLETNDAWQAEKRAALQAELADAEANGDAVAVSAVQSRILLDLYTRDRVNDSTIEKILKPLRAEYGIKLDYDHACMDYWFLNYARYPSHGSENGLASTFNREFGKSLNFDTIFDGYAIQTIFTELRKSYSPMGGEGSQNGTNQITAMFPLAYLSASENIDHSWDDEDEDEYEDSPDVGITDEGRVKALKASSNKKRQQALKLLQEAQDDMAQALRIRLKEDDEL